MGLVELVDKEERCPYGGGGSAASHLVLPVVTAAQDEPVPSPAPRPWGLHRNKPGLSEGVAVLKAA